MKFTNLTDEIHKESTNFRFVKIIKIKLYIKELIKRKFTSQGEEVIKVKDLLELVGSELT